MQNECVFDEERTYRYVLRHRFDDSKPDAKNFMKSVNFVMLNPSTADENQLDPTLKRCRGFAASWGFGSFVVTNLFAYRATDPASMKRQPDPIGPDNTKHITIEAYRAELVVVGWGTHGTHLQRDRRVLSLLRDYALRVCHLGLNGNGTPKHPLYLDSDTPLIDWK